MTPGITATERWQRVKQLTSDALVWPASERASRLAAACGGDEELRREVASLLTAHARAGEFLETPGLAEAGAAAAVVAAAQRESLPIAAGRRIGPYRIIRELGQGGMGVVYLAERADAAFEKSAAIKVVRGGLAGASLMARFREERRILATLDHPNIARLLDGGATDDGLPYFVMEYVDGIPLDAYCEPRSLGQRLALFCEVCAAVQYAHQRLVIHRDLKARNVLVTLEGIPKLLDFGIARLLEPGIGTGDQTRTGLRALTLEGASPEQVRGEPMAVTSDVYALGALLYRLLTGRSPYGAEPRNDVELMRAICEQAPARPSAVAPVALRRALGGDLDWIVLKALRKEPDRRYASVEQLAEDIGRHLGGRPVGAAPDSRRYRARKFARRHRTAVAAGVLLAASLAAGLTATLWQARRAEEQRGRAERRFNDVRTLANAVVGELHDAIKDLPGAMPARKLLVTRAVEYLDGLSGEASGDSSLRLELAVAYQKVGSLQGSPVHASLGDSAAARVSYGKALALLEALAIEEPDNLQARRELARCYSGIGELEWAAGSGAAAALVNYRKALAIRERLSAAAPLDVESRLDLVRTYRLIGNMSPTPDGAMASYERALALCEPLAVSEPARVDVRVELASLYERIGYHHAVAGSAARAIETQHKALEIRRALGEQAPGNVNFRRNLAASHFNLGHAFERAGDLPAALGSYRDVLAIYRELAAADPTDSQARGAVAAAHNNVGRVLARTGDRVGAQQSYRTALAIGEASLATDPTNQQITYGLALTRAGIGNTYATLASEAGLDPAERARRWREARSWLQQGRETLLGMSRRGQLLGDDLAKIDEIAREIARCDAALDRG